VDQPEATTTLEYPFAHPTDEASLFASYLDVRTVPSDPRGPREAPVGWCAG
jgi:hypothetical protein